MGPDTIWIFIPLFALSIPIFAIWTKHQRKLAELRNAAPRVDDKQAAYTRELEDRLRVLERIVTDKGFDVASQIEALRDARQIEVKLDAREKELR